MFKKGIILFCLLFLFLPLMVEASGIYVGKKSGGTERVCYEGFVPCGLGKTVWIGNDLAVENGKCTGTNIEPLNDGNGVSCQLCHLFVMFDGIMDFVFVSVVPPVALLFLVVGGVMFYFGGAKPEFLDTAKKLIKGVFIGVFLVYGSVLIVQTVLSVLGVAEWTGLQGWAENGFFQINCEIELPETSFAPQAPIAQQAEQLPLKQLVSGSNPDGGTCV